MIRKLLTAALVAGTAFTAAPTIAQDSEGEAFIPLLTYRTGAFAGSGIPIANGMADWFTLLNERDGGINGLKIRTQECETGYATDKGVECYEQHKADALVFNPYSTGITLQLIPKASVDGVPVLSMAYGLSAAAEGQTFPWVFNPPMTYWDGASGVISYIAEQEGGLESLEGKKIGYIFLDAGYGREPLTLLEQMAGEYGFELLQYPVPPAEMQNQSSQWLQVRRDRPDYMVMWGWGAMNPTAVKEATRIRYPMDKFIGVWWSGGEADAQAGGAEAAGYKTLNFHGVGDDYPALQDIKEMVVGAGLSKASEDEVGQNLYNRGLLNSFIMSEAIREAQELTGKTVIDAADMRAGLEALEITQEEIAAAGLEGFMQPIKLSCEDHSGHGQMYVQTWNGEAWEPASEYFAPLTDVVQPLLEQAAADYTESNAPWPEREVACAGS